MTRTKSHYATRIALGTVQFGMDYGVANNFGKPDHDRAGKILNRARSAGIDMLDTAIAYGDSETVLGEIGMAGWNVISKLPPLPPGITGETMGKWVREQLEASLQRLGIGSLYGLLLHNVHDLQGPYAKELHIALKQTKQDGLVRKIGWSVYSPHDLEALDPDFRADIVQAPFNAFDRSIVTSGWADRLQSSGCELHTRSLFLQGLLLMAQKDRPKWFDQWATTFNAWDDYLAQNNITAHEACLMTGLAEPAIDRLVIGVDSVEQLEQTLTMSRARLSSLPALPEALDHLPDELTKPSQWELS